MINAYVDSLRLTSCTLADDELNIDHVLVRAPNAQFSASGCKFTPSDNNPKIAADKLSNGLLVHFDDVREAAMQPFPSNVDIGLRNGVSTKDAKFFFKSGARFPVTVYEPPAGSHTEKIQIEENPGTPIVSGTLMLGDAYVDTEACNRDPYHREQSINHWRDEFDQIGKELD